MKQYNVTGMSCAACSARVEKAVSAVEGVKTCSVSLLTNSMSVEGTATQKQIIAAVRKAGYQATPKDKPESTADSDGLFEDKETPALVKRLLSSAVFLLALMYISMGHSMWGWPLPLLEGNYLAIGLLQLLLSLTVMIINNKFFTSGFKAVINKAPNMDTLVAMGSGVSFLWSTYILFLMTNEAMQGNYTTLMHLSHDFYFESAAMIVTLITVGKALEAKSKGKTTDALKSLIKLKPQKARVIRNNEEREISADELSKGDIFVVYPGESIPTDATVLQGHSAVNEASLTGESIPVDKNPGDRVSAATINQSGVLRCEAVAVGEDTTISQIIKMVSDAAATKAPIAKIADKVSGIFVPLVVAIAVITTLLWLLSGEALAFALARGISVLVISCPCALGLATPVAIMVGSGLGAKNGILFKTAESMEKAGKIQIVALDKTGTITKGEPEVTDIIPAEGISAQELLTLACSLEKQSEHPLARAVLAYNKNADTEPARNFRAIPGKGVEGIVGQERFFAGKPDFISEIIPVPEEITEKAHELSHQGKTPLFFASEKQFLGAVFAADVIKSDSAKAIRELKNMGVHVVMLTGDNESTAKAIAKKAGIDEVVAGVLPDGKEKVIRLLSKRGRVAMVGDGINDAPALTRAYVGIAVGNGTDIAIDAGDIVLMKSRLSDIPALLRLSRKTLSVIHQNLFWAFFYNALGIPLAAGAFISLFGWSLNPMFGAAAMSLSSFCVVSNALRLNFTHIHSGKQDKKIKKALAPKNDLREGKQQILSVEGMMCEHCEKRVKDCLEALSFVEQAAADYKKGTVTVSFKKEPDMKQMRKALKQAGYKLR